MNEDLSQLRDRFATVSARLAGVREAFLPERKAQTLAALEEKVSQPDFWNDRPAARETMKQLNAVKPKLMRWDALGKLAGDLEATLELLAESPDPELLAEAVPSLERLEKQLNDFELSLLMNEKFDDATAVMSIHPGAGGTESQDWAEMLLRMYSRFLEREGYKVELLDSQPGEVAGIKSATLRVEGFYAYGYLKCERGVHRLVRISPFDANKRRHTSFASVDVTPELEEAEEIVIDDKEIRVDTFRSSGAGGQHVNKTSSAIRITHLPTNVVVQCQNERSQHQNKAVAMKMLKNKLFQIEQQKREEELARISGVKLDIGFGSQIRNYVFQPYQIVKDLRTGYEVGNIDAVMDGDLMPFIEAYLRHRSKAAAEREAAR